MAWQNPQTGWLEEVNKVLTCKLCWESQGAVLYPPSESTHHSMDSVIQRHGFFFHCYTDDMQLFIWFCLDDPQWTGLCLPPPEWRNTTFNSHERRQSLSSSQPDQWFNITQKRHKGHTLEKKTLLDQQPLLIKVYKLNSKNYFRFT